MSEEKKMRLRYSGACMICDVEIPKGEWGVYLKDLRKVRHVECAVAEPAPAVSKLALTDENDTINGDVEVVQAELLPQPTSVEESSITQVNAEPEDDDNPVYSYGTAGAAARQEHAKRLAREEAAYLARHPRIGKYLIKWRDESHQTRAWTIGAVGEEKVAKRLDSMAGPDCVVMHDRAIKKSKANIDHIVLTSEAVYVIDAKRYKGRPERRVRGGLFSEKTAELWVGGRNQSKLLTGVQKQMGLIEDAIGGALPVKGVLCFVDAEWGLLDSPFQVQGITSLWPKRLLKFIERKDEVNPIVLEALLETFQDY